MQFLRQLQNYGQSVFNYEHPEWQRQARAVIPMELLEQRTNQAISESNSQSSTPSNTPAHITYHDAFFKQLVHWYKHEFFKWVNQPACTQCGGATQAISQSAPTAEESRFGVGIVEVYRCQSCGTVVRFPRYNHAAKLLETRQGRCGEWVQCFMLIARSVVLPSQTHHRYEMRAVHDWTDHVWVEYYSYQLDRWVHCDPCEAVIDRPDLYETGWGKKLNYCIAFSIDECVDVTKRYTKDYQSVKQRRTMIPELILQVTLSMQNLRMLNVQAATRKQELLRRTGIEQTALQSDDPSNNQSNQSMASGVLAGRTTGSAEWRRERGEIGDEQKTNQAIQQQQIEAQAIKQTNSQSTNQASSQSSNQSSQSTTSKPALQPNDTIPINTQTNNRPSSQTTNPSTSQSSNQPTKQSTCDASDGKSQVKLLFQQYRDQLTVGCGNSSCNRSNCASNKAFVAPATPAELATLALKLTSKHKTDPQLH